MDAKRRIVYIELPGENIALDVPAVEPCKGFAKYSPPDLERRSISASMHITNMIYDPNPQIIKPFRTKA